LMKFNDVKLVEAEENYNSGDQFTLE